MPSQFAGAATRATPVQAPRVAFPLPPSQQVVTWLLFWPLLTLIARQAVYFAGPARNAATFQNGAAMGGQRGSHLYLYVNLLFLLGFVLAGYIRIWTVLRRNPLIPAITLLTTCSALWSVSVVITLQMNIEVGLCTLFACYLSSRFTTEHLMQLLIFMGTAAALMSILFVVALPKYGIFQGYSGNAWQGICDHKNTLGISMSFLLTPVFFTKRCSPRHKLLYATLVLFLIYESQSRGAWLDTAGMLLFVGWLITMRKVRARDALLITFVTAALALAIVALGIHFWPLIATGLGKNASMSGRTGIYAEVWRSIMKRPLLGYGFGAFWYTGNVEMQRLGLALRWPNIGYAESGFLELALQAGLLGVGLLLIMLGNAAIRGLRLMLSSDYSPRVGWFMTILVLTALSNIEAGWFMTGNTLDWVLVLIACIGLNKEMGRIQAVNHRRFAGAHAKQAAEDS